MRAQPSPLPRVATHERGECAEPVSPTKMAGSAREFQPIGGFALAAIAHLKPVKP